MPGCHPGCKPARDRSVKNNGLTGALPGGRPGDLFPRLERLGQLTEVIGGHLLVDAVFVGILLGQVERAEDPVHPRQQAGEILVRGLGAFVGVVPVWKAGVATSHSSQPKRQRTFAWIKIASRPSNAMSAPKVSLVNPSR